MSAFPSHRISRRPLLQIGGSGLLGLTLPKLLQARQQQLRQPASSQSSGRARSVIFLFQWGGPSHVDTFDMKPNAPRRLSITVQSRFQFGTGAAGL